MERDINYCAACHIDHQALDFTELPERVGIFTHWALCPETLHVILLAPDGTTEDIGEPGEGSLSMVEY